MRSCRACTSSSLGIRLFSRLKFDHPKFSAGAPNNGGARVVSHRLDAGKPALTKEAAVLVCTCRSCTFSCFQYFTTFVARSGDRKSRVGKEC